MIFPQKNKVNEVKVISWVVMVLYCSPVESDFQGRRQAKRKSKARETFLHWLLGLHAGSSSST